MTIDVFYVLLNVNNYILRTQDEIRTPRAEYRSIGGSIGDPW